MIIFSISRLENIFDKDYPYPNCFGNLLTPQIFLTTLSCFIKVKEVARYHRYGFKVKVGEEILYGLDELTIPEEIIVVRGTKLDSCKCLYM